MPLRAKTYTTPCAELLPTVTEGADTSMRVASPETVTECPSCEVVTPTGSSSRASCVQLVPLREKTYVRELPGEPATARVPSEESETEAPRLPLMVPSVEKSWASSDHVEPVRVYTYAAPSNVRPAAGVAACAPMSKRVASVENAHDAP